MASWSFAARTAVSGYPNEDRQWIDESLWGGDKSVVDHASGGGFSPSSTRIDVKSLRIRVSIARPPGGLPGQWTSQDATYGLQYV